MLSPLQQDALREFMNVTIGQAGSVLSEMVSQKVHLEVPEVYLLQNLQETEVGKGLSGYLSGHVVSSVLRFEIGCNGVARLVFPRDKGKLLVNLLLGEELLFNGEGGDNSFSETDTDAMKEIGNVLLNVIVGSLGNLLETRIEYSLPEVEFLYLKDGEQRPALCGGYYTLVIRNTFVVGDTRIEGAIFVMLCLDSATQLLGKIDELLVELYG
ncbi:chec-like family protein [Heliomicrobium modesticaldum Ice1]|uniref:Chec-like family protein n=1 Tax=Heliobacterium modesticaldum (strain ATCC 51547 / Ice1) TaxID=498761 RepID=B0TG82_HELMI|nr:chemotaxis protein CheC [Heliomicrobium modesticaldum]ABZ84578.1 chec-like family protein [Heliomicrobium modesticaldum Ice1]